MHPVDVHITQTRASNGNIELKGRLGILCTADDVYCNAVWDGYRCWQDTSPNTTVSQLCPWTLHDNFTGINTLCPNKTCDHVFDNKLNNNCPFTKKIWHIYY